MPESQHDLWRKGFGHGKLGGARLHADYGPPPRTDPRPRDQLRIALAELIRETTLGRPAARTLRDDIRRMAARNAAEDWDGTALAAMAYLCDRYADPAARAWFQVMLAGAGRYREAVGLEPVWAPGRPVAAAYVMLVSAHALLGDDDSAHRFLELLGTRFPALREEFVSVWDETRIGRQLDRLVRTDHGGRLPVFLHLPFCGGTSMISSLKQTVPWSGIVDIGRRFGLYQIERAQALAPDRTGQLRLVHLHHPFPIAVAGRDLSYFTVLRDPVSQLSSGFYKRRESAKIVGTHDTDSTTFAQHADYTIRNGLTNMLARQIAALHPDLAGAYRRHYRGPGAYTTTATEEQMFWFSVTDAIPAARLLRMARETLDERFHVVGTMRHLGASHLAGAATVGLPVIQRVGHRGRSGQPDDGPDPATESRLRQANDVDQTLYEEYTERFERDYPELITAVESTADHTSVAAAAETERLEQLRDGVTAVQ